MTYHKQDQYCKNCTATCIACIFDLAVEDVPNLHHDDWTTTLNKFLLPYGLQYVEINYDKRLMCYIDKVGYHLISYENHTCVGFNGEFYYDPSPTPTKGELKTIGLFIKVI